MLRWGSEESCSLLLLPLPLHPFFLVLHSSFLLLDQQEWEDRREIKKESRGDFRTVSQSGWAELGIDWIYSSRLELPTTDGRRYKTLIWSGQLLTIGKNEDPPKGWCSLDCQHQTDSPLIQGCVNLIKVTLQLFKSGRLWLSCPKSYSDSLLIILHARRMTDGNLSLTFENFKVHQAIFIRRFLIKRPAFEVSCKNLPVLSSLDRDIGGDCDRRDVGYHLGQEQTSSLFSHKNTWMLLVPLSCCSSTHLVPVKEGRMSRGRNLQAMEILPWLDSFGSTRFQRSESLFQPLHPFLEFVLPFRKFFFRE